MLTTETIREPSKAYPKLSTLKPSMNDAANQNKEAFMIIINNPRVMIVIGRVRIKRIGLTNKFKSPIIIAAIIAG